MWDKVEAARAELQSARYEYDKALAQRVTMSHGNDPMATHDAVSGTNMCVFCGGMRSLPLDDLEFSELELAFYQFVPGCRFCLDCGTTTSAPPNQHHGAPYHSTTSPLRERILGYARDLEKEILAANPDG
jgi:hypothetical protein